MGVVRCMSQAAQLMSCTFLLMHHLWLSGIELIKSLQRTGCDWGGWGIPNIRVCGRPVERWEQYPTSQGQGPGAERKDDLFSYTTVVNRSCLWGYDVSEPWAPKGLGRQKRECAQRSACLFLGLQQVQWITLPCQMCFG